MLQAFGIHWVMPGSVTGLLSCWHQWLGKHNLHIWNLILGCLMWIVWLERNRCSFENLEKTVDELKVLCQRSLFEWSRCWGFTNSSSLSKFMFSLRLSFWFSLSFVLSFVFSVPCCSSSWTTCSFLFFSLITVLVLWLPIKKKKMLRHCYLRLIAWLEHIFYLISNGVEDKMCN